MLKLYRSREAEMPNTGTVVVDEEVGHAGRVRALDPRYDLRNHSPDGFAWGYHGSGPAQLALALLADATGDDHLAERHYQHFKGEIVSRLQGNWTLSAEDVLRWLISHQSKRRT